ncbi:MAG TPA: ATP-binding cassette domain-containing protein, partial [Longimicrobiales bacterium]
MSAVLSARGLQQNYGAKRVVDVDEFAIQQGEVVALLGANGAGKSTLFRLLLGLERPAAGVVQLNGRAAGVFQRPYLFDGTVADNLGYGLHGGGVTRAERRDRVTALADSFALRDILDARVHSLSGGETQRVAL